MSDSFFDVPAGYRDTDLEMASRPWGAEDLATRSLDFSRRII